MSWTNVMGWISVKDRLPEFEEEVLLMRWGENKAHIICKVGHLLMIVKDGPSFSDGNSKLSYVTHWMPLPEHPKDES